MIWVILWWRWHSDYVFYQPTFSTLDLKEDKDIEHVFAGRPKEIFKSTLKPLYDPLTPNILDTKQEYNSIALF